MKFIPVERADSTYMINVDDLSWANGKNSCGCSFNVLPARLLDMSFPDYLRFLRANGAKLCGKNGYSFGIFKDKDDCQKICNMLNKEWKRVEKFL